MAKALLDSVREKAARFAASRQIVPTVTQLTRGVRRTSVYMGFLCFEFVVFVGRFAFSVSTISLYAANVSGIIILLCAFRICIYGVYFTTILFYSGYQHSLRFTRSVLSQIVPNGGNDIDQSLSHSGQESRVAMPATRSQIIKSEEVSRNSDSFRQRLSLIDTGTDSYLRQDNQSMRNLVRSNVKITTAGPDELSARESGLLSMIVRDRTGNMHELLVENALVVPNLTRDLTSHLQFVEKGHTVFFHKSESGILLNSKPRFMADDVVIPFFTGQNGLQYLQEFVPTEEKTTAMVAERQAQLTTADVTHITLNHICPTIMKRLHRSIKDMPRFKHLCDFKCHSCIEAKMKHKPKPGRSITIITRPGQIVSVDIVGKFNVKSLEGSEYGIAFIDHFTNVPFLYGMAHKSDYPKYLKKFLVDFRELFKDSWKVQHVRILRSDNAQEMGSAEVQKIEEEEKIHRHHSNPYEKFQDGKAEKCIGDCWSMTRVALLFSNTTRKLWERSWKNSQEVKRCLPCAANVDFQSPYQLVYGDKVSISHLKPFGSLLYVLLDKDQVKDWKFDPRAGACIFIGPGETEGRKGVIGYTFDFRNKGRKGRVVYSSQFWSDPTFFPFRNAGEERVTSLSCGVFLSGKETIKAELPVPDCYEEWIRQAHEETLSTQQIQAEPESGDHESDSQSEKTEIVGYDKSTGRYALRTAGETNYVDASEMFERLNQREVIYVDGTGSIPKMTLWYGEDDEVFFYEGSEVFVDKMTVDDFNKRLEEIFDTTHSMQEYDSIRDNIQKIIMEQLIREDQDRTSAKDSLNDTGTYSKSYSFTATLQHDEFPEVSVAYAAKVKNSLDSDDLTLAQALAIPEEISEWKESMRVEFTSLIDKRNVFEAVNKSDVPPGARIFNLLILLKRKRNKFREISKYKCRLVMDGSRQIVGVDVFDTFAPVIDYSTVRLLISTAFGNRWDMFHWDISVAFTNADSHENTYVKFPQNFPSDICPGFTGGTIAKLNKNLYGSKSAPKWWYKCLYSFLIEIGFKSVAGHPCLLIRITIVAGDMHIVVIGIFVDDLLVTGNLAASIEDVKTQMGNRFEFTDQGKLEYYLGVEVTQEDDHNLLLHQQGYIKKVLETFKMSECKSVSTPLPLNLDLSLKDSPEVVDTELQGEYRAIIGSLMYLYQWTRPDLGFAVTFLSRYLHRPGVKHMMAAKHTLRYLQGTKTLGIRYTRDLNRLSSRGHDLNVMYGLSDSDFAGCKDTSRSTSGYIVLLNGGPIAYYSGRQSTTALCTAMAETIALAKLVVKIKHLRALMHDLQVRQNQETQIESTIVWVDNTAALAVATGSDFTHETVKHVTVKVRFIQECVQRKIVRISYVATRKNISDMMTKQSVGPQFISHRDFTLGYVDSFAGVDTFAGTALFRRSRRRVRGIRV